VWSFLSFVLTLADNFCCAWFVYRIFCWCGICRQGLALSIGGNWVGSTWRQRQNSVSETLRVLNYNRMTDNVQEHNWSELYLMTPQSNPRVQRRLSQRNRFPSGSTRFMLRLPQNDPSLPPPYTTRHRSCPAQLAESCYPIKGPKLHPATHRPGRRRAFRSARVSCALPVCPRDHARQKNYWTRSATVSPELDTDWQTKQTSYKIWTEI
jgi:hypothetical protein